MKDLPAISALIEQMKACNKQDRRLDEHINDTIGMVRAVSVLGLNGSGKRYRYFGPNANPHGRGSSVPSPTKTAESRKRALKSLEKLLRKVHDQ